MYTYKITDNDAYTRIYANGVEILFIPGNRPVLARRVIAILADEYNAGYNAAIDEIACG